MFAALRQIYELGDASPLSSEQLRLSSTSPPTLQLQRAVFAALSSSEHNLTCLHEEMEKKTGCGVVKEGDTKATEQCLVDFIAHTVQDHLRAVTYEAALTSQFRKQEEQNKKDYKDVPVEVDHSVLMNSDRDVAQLLWMNRTMALGATTSALEAKANRSETCIKKGKQQKQQEERSTPNLQETVRYLRESFTALRFVLIERKTHSTTAADATERSHRHPYRETGAKRPRIDNQADVEVENPRPKKAPFSFAVKIGGNLLHSQLDDRAAPTAFSSRENYNSGTLQKPYEEQGDQRQQKTDGSFRGGVSLQSAFQTKSQTTPNFDRYTKQSLVQGPVVSSLSQGPLIHSSSLAADNTMPQQQQQQPSLRTPQSTAGSSCTDRRRLHQASGGLSTGDGVDSFGVEKVRRRVSMRDSRSGNSAAPARRLEDGNEELHAGTGGQTGGGFITAGEQLAVDVKLGRALPSSLSLQRRTPALGLRRSGFAPPFQQRQQRTSSPPPSRANMPVSDGPGPTHKNTAAGSHESTRGARGNNGTVGNRDDSDSERGEYPASLLLPDGSVPPILRPLDPKLVTQVAMEILEHGAGAANVGWDDIAGLEHAKRSVEEAIVWPLRRPDLFVGLRDPPRGLLLFGPPGTGKTMIARAIANRAQCTFLNISASSLMSKWMGDGEKLVRCMFAVAVVKQPSVIFIDEIDSLLSMRGEGEMDSVRRVKTEFLVQLDGVATDRGDRVLLIGATNRPEELDEAARRRMEKRLYIPLPDALARVELFKRLLHTMEVQQRQQRLANGGEEENIECTVHVLDEKDIAEIAAATEGYSGADIKQVCREAAMGPLREVTMRLKDVSLGELRPIQRKDFMQALKRIRSSVGISEVRRYIEWNDQFGSSSLREEEVMEEEILGNTQ